MRTEAYGARAARQWIVALGMIAITLAPPVFSAIEGELEKVGEARLKVLLWSIYDSRLYTPDGRYEPGTRPLRLEIEYLRDIRAKDLVERTAEEWDGIGVTHERRSEWLQRLLTLWPDIREDDVLSVELDADSHATFYHNGELLGTIEDGAFGESFVDIWLSPKTSRPEVRRTLIGGRDAP